MSLVALVVSSLVRRNIQRLTGTYATLSLADIADLVGLSSASEARQQVGRMIESGEVNARIEGEGEAGRVCFLEVEDGGGEASVAHTARLNQQIEKCVGLGSVLETKMGDVSTSTEFASKSSAGLRSS